jgi:hypothetical protein
VLVHTLSPQGTRNAPELDTRNNGPAAAAAGSRSHIWWGALFVGLLSLALYITTLAPGLLWEDAAHLQLHAVRGMLQGSAGSHPAWVWIAHQFTKIPLGDILWRVNLVSAVAGALALGILYLAMREVGLEQTPALLATLALSISHTFWSYAVRAEIYVFAAAVAMMLVWAGLRWYHTGRPAYLLGLGFVAGLGYGAHLLVFLYLPGLLWLFWAQRARLRMRDLGLAALAALLAASPWIALTVRDAYAQHMSASQTVRWALFTFEGDDFGHLMFSFAPRYLPAAFAEWLAFLGLQFVGFGFLLGIAGLAVIWRTAGRQVAVFILLLYLGAMAFSFGYRVGDRYVFYLPSYLPFAFWIGFGAQWFLQRIRGFGRLTRSSILGALTFALVVIPVSTYRLAPALASRGITFRDTRHVPGPQGAYYFLWPPKAGYNDPVVFAHEALGVAPANAVLLANPVLAYPLECIQALEKLRPDVTVGYCCEGLGQAIAEAGARPVVAADMLPPTVLEASLGPDYSVRKLGPLYLVIKNASVGGN